MYSCEGHPERFANLSTNEISCPGEYLIKTISAGMLATFVIDDP